MNNVSRNFGLLASLWFVAACGSPQDLDKVAVGQDITITKSNGGVVEGKVASLDEKNVQVTTGQTTKSIAKDEIVKVNMIDSAKPADLPAAAKFREYTVPDGTRLSLRLRTALDSETSRVEDRVEAELAEGVTIAGANVLPAGSTVKGTVSAVQGSGKVKGLASLSVHFTDIAAAGRSDHYDIDATYRETAHTTKGDDAVKIGIGAGAGAAIGGLLGGKSGAATGAAVGGGAGTAAVLSTKGDEVERPAGALVTVTLQKDVEVRVPIG